MEQRHKDLILYEIYPILICMSLGIRDLQIIFFQSVSAVWADSILMHGEDSQTLIAVINFVWTFLMEMVKHLRRACLAPTSFHYLIFFIS